MDADDVVNEAAGEGHGWPSPALFLSIAFGLMLAAAAWEALAEGDELAGRVMAPAVQRVRALPPLNTGYVPPPEAPPTPEELSAARGMEAMLVNLMIEEMRKSVPEDELVPPSQAERVFKQMLDQEYAQRISESGSLGIADLVIAQMRGKR